MGNQANTVRPHLDRLLARFDRSFLEPDPLAVALKYRGNRADLEVALLISALFAYGRADLIQKTVSWILDSMEGAPARFCVDFTKDNGSWNRSFKYRFNDRSDLVALVKAIGTAIREYGSLEKLFLAGDDPAEERVKLSFMADSLRRYSGRQTRSFSHLVSDPSGGGACKRWNLFMRWAVRKDEVDPGPWSGSVSKSRLVMPLDTHVARISRQLGLLERKQDDYKAALELTRFLRELDRNDPVKYDFAICSYGKLGYCEKKISPEKCFSCELSSICNKAIKE